MEVLEQDVSLQRQRRKRKQVPRAIERKEPENQQLTEKTRPRCLKDLILPPSLRAFIATCIEKKDFLHMLFYGPPGCGKTSTAKVIARNCLTDMKQYLLEVNASHDRGLTALRSLMKGFISRKLTSSEPFRIVLLDEVDAMDRLAFNALRRIIEDHQDTTRFILICNDVGKIPDPITSRCQPIHFPPLSSAALHSVVDRVSPLRLHESVIQHLMRAVDGDLRQAMTTLEILQRVVNAPEDIAGAVSLPMDHKLVIVEEKEDIHVLPVELEGNAEGVRKHVLELGARSKRVEVRIPRGGSWWNAMSHWLQLPMYLRNQFAQPHPHQLAAMIATLNKKELKPGDVIAMAYFIEHYAIDFYACAEALAEHYNLWNVPEGVSLLSELDLALYGQKKDGVLQFRVFIIDLHTLIHQ